MSTDLAIIEIKNPALVFVSNGCDPLLQRIKEEVRKEQPNLDISTDAGRKAIASLAYKIAQTKTKLDALGKGVTEDQKNAIKVVDAERRRVWDELEALQKEVRAPLTAWEEAEKARVANHEQKVTQLAALDKWEGITPTAADVQLRIAALLPYKEWEWEEFVHRANLELERVTSSLALQLADRTKAEEDAAELIRLRAAEDERNRVFDAMYADAREENAAFDAAAKANKAAAEKIETERVRAENAEKEQQAEKDRSEKKRVDEHGRRLQILAAKDFFQEDPTTAAVQARLDSLKDFEGIDWQEFSGKATETKIKVVKHLLDMLDDAEKRDEEAAEKKRLKSIEDAAEDERKKTAAREKDLDHKKKINNEALAVVQAIIDELTMQDKNTTEVAKAIIGLIAQGKVPHVKINY